MYDEEYTFDDVENNSNDDFFEDGEDGNSQGGTVSTYDDDANSSNTDEDSPDSENENDENITSVVVKAAAKPKKATGPVFITGNERNTKNFFVTKYEYAFLIGYRAEQIENRNPPINPITLKNAHKNLTFSLDIAKYELDNREIPFPVLLFRRISFSGVEKYEIWNPRELVLPHELVCIKKTVVGPSSEDKNHSEKEVSVINYNLFSHLY